MGCCQGLRAIRATPPTNRTSTHVAHMKIFVAVLRMSPSVNERSKADILPRHNGNPARDYRPSLAELEPADAEGVRWSS